MFTFKGLSPRIGVVGSSKPSASGYQKALEVGREIAGRGGVVICGGLSGVMEAAARGAREAGGLTIGVLPGRDGGQANPYIAIPIVTDLGHARNIVIVHTAEVLIAIEGNYGTLSEIAVALKTGKKVFGLDSWPGIAGVIAAVSPHDAVDQAFQAVHQKVYQPQLKQ
ncbi:MAG: TIGR00725 family protein [Deltaproteobacteria bacterium]|nr:TIGR00725 family protein [Deltaproteobacteria bacterium]